MKKDKAALNQQSHTQEERPGLVSRVLRECTLNQFNLKYDI